MGNFRSIYFNELQADYKWYLNWIFGISLYALLILLIYPGDEGIKDFMELLNSDQFKAFLGDIGGEDPGFALWIALMAPLLSLLFMIFALFAGVRVAIKSVDDNTGELIHTMPVNLKLFIFYRWVVAASFILLLLISWLLPIALYSNSIPLSRLLTTGWWGFLFTLAGLGLGMLLGLLTGGIEKGQQTGLLLILTLYIFQILSRFQENLDWLHNLNILDWYLPNNILLGKGISWNLVTKLAITNGAILFISIERFTRIDLIKERGVSFKIPYLSKIKQRFSKNEQRRKLKHKSVKNSFYTFWIRPLEKRYPYCADFVYSERRVLLISFFAILMIWPLQLMTYPGDEKILSAIRGFQDSPLMDLFMYDHDVYNNPWLWYIISQSIGIHWMMLLPLVVYWAKKLLKREGESQTGEILGSIPVNPQRVVFERLLAIILEIIWMILWMILWLILSEAVVDKTINLTWEIIAIISLLPLYYFLLTLSLVIGLSYKKNGVKLGKILVLAIFLLFLVGILNDNLNKWYIKGIFGLYDPVAIIIEESLFVEHYGVFVLSFFSIVTTILLYFTSKNYSWLNIDEG